MTSCLAHGCFSEQREQQRATVCGEEIARIKKKARPKNVHGLNETAEVRLSSKPIKDTMKLVSRMDAKKFVSDRSLFKAHFDANLEAFKKNSAKRAAPKK